ncbi:hypothetical protein BBJ28_00022055, partial [Nothophytophthora sp. Chile5]
RHDKRANNVQVFARGHLDPCGSAPALMTRSFLTRLAPTLVEVEHSADVKYIMRTNLVLPKEEFFARRAALKARNRRHLQCTACGKRFGRLKRHVTQCRACGEAACGRCLMTYTLCLPQHECRDAEHPSAVIPERFCLRCLFSGRLDRKGQRMDGFLTGAQLVSGPPTAELTVDEDDDDYEDDDDVSVVEFAMLDDTRGVGGSTMHAAISEAQRLQRLKQRYLDNEKRKYLAGGPQAQQQRFAFEQHQLQQMHRYQQQSRSGEWSRSEGESMTGSSRSGGRPPPFIRRSSQPMNNSTGSSSQSSAYYSTSTSSSVYSSTEAAAAATAALQDNTGFHAMERSISEQEVLLRSLQSEYAKVSLGRAQQQSHSSSRFHAQQMRNSRLAGWKSSEQTPLALPASSSSSLYDIDSD